MDRAIELLNEYLRIYNRDSGEYLNLVGDTSRVELQLLGDTGSQLSGLMLLGVNNSNSNSGVLYWTLTDEGLQVGYVFSIYKDIAKTQLVAKAIRVYSNFFPDRRLLLHNRLGSPEELETSYVGPSGSNTIGSVITYTTGKFGNGVRIPATRESVYQAVIFKDILLNADGLGCIEFYFKSDIWSWDGTEASDGESHILLGSFPGSQVSIIFKLDHENGHATWSIHEGTRTLTMTTTNLTIESNTMTLLCVNWASSSMQIYKDTILVEDFTDGYHYVQTHSKHLSLVLGFDDLSLTKGAYGLFDNIKIWGFKKVNFSDSLNEYGYPLIIPSAELLFHARFEENYNTVIGPAFTVLEGEPTFEDGVFGKAVSFDGSSTIMAPFKVPGDIFTIEFFMYWSSENDTNPRRFLCTNHYASAGAIMLRDVWGSLEFFVTNADGSDYVDLCRFVPSTDIEDDWHHFAVTYDGTTVRVYIDNVLIDSDTLDGPCDFISSIYLGSSEPGFGENFIGMIDNIKVFNIEKTDFSDRFTEMSGLTLNPILHNRLESNNDILVSDVGVPGKNNYDSYYEAFQFGNGIFVPQIRASTSNAIKFNPFIFSKNGCVEFYIKPKLWNAMSGRSDDSSDHYILGTQSHSPGEPKITFVIYSASDCQIIINDGTTDFILSSSLLTLTNGIPQHLAIVWSMDLATISLYSNNILITQVSAALNISGTDSIGSLSLGSDENSLTFGAFALFDNIKIWNYAKTDFSDRFTELSLEYTSVTEKFAAIEPMGSSGITGNVIINSANTDNDGGNIINVGEALNGIVKINDMNTGAISNVLEYLRRFSSFLIDQLYANKAQGMWLDYYGKKFFAIERKGGESDADYYLRIKSIIFATKFSPISIVRALENYGDNVQIIEGIDDGAFADVSFTNSYRDFNISGQDVVKGAISGIEGGLPFFFRVLMSNVDPADYKKILAIIEAYKAAGVAYIIELV